MRYGYIQGVGRMRCAVIALAAALLAGCATTAENVVPRCTVFVPPSWSSGVSPAQLPDTDTAQDWVAFAFEQTSRLEIANNRMADTMYIISQCEDKAVKAAD